MPDRACRLTTVSFPLNRIKPSSTTSFGLLIAYVVPGFTSLWGASYLSPTLRSWLGAEPAQTASLGGFLFVTVASIVAGLTVSTIRWATIDPVLHRLGVPRPGWNFSRLQTHIDAYCALVENHYRYYQFYANMVVATYGSSHKNCPIGIDEK